MTFFQALMINPLLLYAVYAGLIASVVGGVIGSYVVVKRITFICGSIAHTALGGIGVSLWLQRTRGVEWFSPLYGALLAAIFSALILGWIRISYRQREDTVIAALWSVGMAVGIIFISQTPGFNVELTNFLVGNILWVTPNDLFLLGALDVVVVACVLCFHKKFLAICYDEEQASLQGIPVNRLYILLLLLTAITIVLLIQVVGIVLVMTMLTIPAAMANLFTTRLSHMMVLAVVICAVLCLSGLAVSYHLDWPSGATIALVAGIVYAISLPLKSIRN